jgi:hypothetical protein
MSFLPDGVEVESWPSAATPSQRPCKLWADRLYGSPDLTTMLDPDQLLLALQMATELLWAKTGRRYGTCSATVWPCTEQFTGDPMAWPWLNAYMSSWGSWSGWYGILPLLNLTCGICGPGPGCSCTYLHRIDLGRPVNTVDTVTINGDILDSSAYRLDENHWLTRVDGDSWPTSQDLSVEGGTWSVEFTYGYAPTAGGKLACGQLAHEIGLAILGNANCRLPQRVASISRQGVTVSFDDLQQFLQSGLTGLPLVDEFIITSNPNRLQSRTRVYRADAPKRYSRIGNT